VATELLEFLVVEVHVCEGGLSRGKGVLELDCVRSTIRAELVLLHSYWTGLRGLTVGLQKLKGESQFAIFDNDYFGCFPEA